MCVLLVEDEPLIREIMTESLQDAGFDVQQVESGDLAVALLEQQKAHFTILVTDFHMPGSVDGSQLAERVRAIHPTIPVIIASGRPEALQASWQRELGYRLLKKPYLPSELIRVVQSLTTSRTADPQQREPS